MSMYSLIGYLMMTSSNGNIFRVTGPFVRGIPRSPVNSPHKGQWCGASHHMELLPERHRSPREGTMESSAMGYLGLQIKVHRQCDQSHKRSKLETLGRPKTGPNTEIHISSNPSRCLAQLCGRVPECEVEQTTNKQNAPAHIRRYSAWKAVDAGMWVNWYIKIIDCCAFTDSVWGTPGLSWLYLPDSVSSSTSTV